MVIPVSEHLAELREMRYNNLRSPICTDGFYLHWKTNGKEPE